MPKLKKNQKNPQLYKPTSILIQFLKYTNVSGKGTERMQSAPLFYTFWISP